MIQSAAIRSPVFLPIVLLTPIAWLGAGDAGRDHPLHVPSATAFLQIGEGRRKGPIPTRARVLAENVPEPHRGGSRPSYLTGSPFDTALKRSISTSWSNVNVRDALRGIAENQQVAILLDRRIDPSQTLTADVDYHPVLDVIKAVAARLPAEVSVVGNTVFVGPREATSRLRTLVALRSGELLEESQPISKGRKRDLGRRRTIYWDDLDSPRAVLAAIGDRYGLTIHNPEAIPHDLWAGGTLAGVTAWEATQLILIQYDLTFEWTEGGPGIRIVPVPAVVAIEKLFSPNRESLAEAMQRWQHELPGARLEVFGDRVRVRGTVEQIEALARLLRPVTKSTLPRSSTDAPPLSRQEFTLRIKRVPALAVMRKLEQTGTVFDYDAASLQSAGIDLETMVDMDVEMIDADGFFHALFDPLGVAFSIDGDTVKLSPKSNTPPANPE